MLGILIKSGFQDKISIAWSIILPALILLGGSFFIKSEEFSFSFLLGVLAISALSVGLMGSAFDYFSHKSSGILKVVAISKTGIRRFLGYYALARVIITVLTLGVLILLASVTGYGISGSVLPGLLVFSLLSSVVSVLLGITSGNIGSSAGAVATISNILLIVLVTTCGLFYSLDILPAWLSTAFSFSPFEMMAQHAYSVAAQPIVIFYNVALIGFLLLLCVITFRYE